MSQLTDEEEEELIQKVLECCETAYLNGVDSTDIYKTLHSSQFLSSIQNKKFSKKEEKIDKKLNQVDFAKSELAISPQEADIYKFISKTFLVIISLTIATLLGHILLCKTLDINPLKWFPSLQERRCLLPSHPLIMEMVRPIANCSICLPMNFSVNNMGLDIQNYSPVIELNKIPTQEFFKEIAYSSRPLIIRKGAVKGGMPMFFDFEKLKEIFESEEGGVDTVSEECQFLPFRSPFQSLRDAFDLISESKSVREEESIRGSSSSKALWTDPWYIGWSNCHPGVAAKLRKLFPRPTFLPEDSESSAIDWIFIGSPGLGAAMHIDYVRRPSWQAQLSGVKTWYLRPPPECENICPDTVTFTINPGDLLFLETNTWYHQTFIEGDTLSISIGSEYD